jgi:hypothetical protein
MLGYRTEKGMMTPVNKKIGVTVAPGVTETLKVNFH